MTPKNHEIIELAGKLFRFLYRDKTRINQKAYELGCLFFDYAPFLVSKDMPIITPYLYINLNQTEWASDLGVAESSYRVKDKNFENLTPKEQLEKYCGFEFEKGYRIKKEDGKIIAKKGTIKVPLFIKHIEEVEFTSSFLTNKIGESGKLKLITDLQNKINGLYDELSSKPWQEIDYNKISINSFLITRVDKDYNMKLTRLQRLFFCLFDKHGVEFRKEENHQFNNIKAFLNKAQGNFELVQDAVLYLYHEQQMDILTISKALTTYISREVEMIEVEKKKQTVEGVDLNNEDLNRYKENLTKQLNKEKLQKLGALSGSQTFMSSDDFLFGKLQQLEDDDDFFTEVG